MEDYYLLIINFCGKLIFAKIEAYTLILKSVFMQNEYKMCHLVANDCI